MKKLIKCKSIALLGAIVMLTACSSDESSKLTLSKFKQSDCKKPSRFSKGDDLYEMLGHETIRLKAMGNDRMKIIHTNARFTCDATVDIKASLDGSTITVAETAPPETKCICPYDIEAEIGPLSATDYTIVVKSNNKTVLTKSFTYNASLDKTFDADVK